MTILSLKFTLKWMLFAVLSSVSAIAVCYSFRYLLLTIYSHINKLNVSNAIFPIFGAFICIFIIYKLRPKSAGEGIPAYLAAVNRKNGKMTFTTSIFKYMAALVTLGSGGSGGIVGPLVRVNSGIMAAVGQFLFKLGFDDANRRTIVICGASSTCAAILGAPVGAGLFAVEVLKRANMTYLDLFPSILSSCCTIAIMKHFELPSIYPFKIINIYTPSWDIFLIIGVGLFSGFYSLGYTKLYLFTRKIMGRNQLKKRNIIGSAIIVSLIAFAVDPNLLGTSFDYISNLSTGRGDWPFSDIFQGRYIFIIFIVLAILKGVTNCITVGSGLSGGFTGPAIIMGLFIGAAFASLFGYTADSGVYSAMLVAGMCGVLSSSVNVPIAASILGAEIFGPSFALPATISAIIAFQVARSTTLYDFQFDQPDNNEKYIQRID